MAYAFLADLSPAFRPKNAPSESRGPLWPIRTNVPGIEICQYLPLLAQRADRFSLIRSLHHEMSAHNDGSIEVLTGKTPRVSDPTSQAHSEHPDFGMIAARIRGPRPDGLPQYIGVQRAPFMVNPSYLGVAHKAFDTGDPSRAGFSPPNLTLVTGIDNRRLDDRRSLIGQFDRFRRVADSTAWAAECRQRRATMQRRTHFDNVPIRRQRVYEELTSSPA